MVTCSGRLLPEQDQLFLHLFVIVSTPQPKLLPIYQHLGNPPYLPLCLCSLCIAFEYWNVLRIIQSYYVHTSECQHPQVEEEKCQMKSWRTISWAPVYSQPTMLKFYHRNKCWQKKCWWFWSWATIGHDGNDPSLWSSRLRKCFLVQPSMLELDCLELLSGYNSIDWAFYSPLPPWLRRAGCL